MSRANAKFNRGKYLSTYEEISLNVLGRRSKGEGAEFRKMIAKVFEECRTKDLGLSTDMVIAVGRKPFWVVSRPFFMLSHSLNGSA